MSILHIAFYPSDWLAGTRGLSDAETGVYITLICRMYEMAGPIERDDERLSRLCGSKSKSSFLKALNYLIDEGKITEENGELFNFRVKKEIENVVEKSEKASQAARQRWEQKSNKNKGRVNADASSKHPKNDAKAMHKPCSEVCQLELEPDKERKDTNVSLANDTQSELVLVEQNLDLIEAAVEAWNQLATDHGLPKVAAITDGRKTKLKARLKEAGGLEGWQHVLSEVAASSFLTGRNKNGWRATFDFVVTKSKFVNIVEGHYRDNENKRAGSLVMQELKGLKNGK